MIVERPFYNEKILQENYSFHKFKPENIFNSGKNYVKKYYSPNLNCFKRYAYNRLPILKWITKYNIKQNILKDLIGGLTIGVVQIPQSMAYSLMAGLPPINGLYVAFFSVMIYFFFGTSRHLSLGTYGIISLMIAESLQKYEGVYYPKVNHKDEVRHPRYGLDNIFRGYRSVDENEHKNDNHFLSENPDEAKVMIASSLAFFSGIIQILFGIFHAGAVTKYLSDIIVAAFTTGAAYHIVISQIGSLLGIDIFHKESSFKLLENLIEIFKEIKNTNLATILISLVSIILLYTVKHFINQKFKKKLIAPIPIELIVVILGTVLSYVFDFKKKFKVKVVGNIPLGIPSPTVPPLRLFNLLIKDSFSIAIVSFALNISMGKLFAKKYNYYLDANQELFSYGLGNLLSSFFKGFPSCVGLSRCVILEGTGAQTQLFSAISSVLVLIVIVGIGFLFKTLPISCLASIIVVALLSMLTEVKQIIPIFKRSKLEALAWLCTFLSVMILDVDYGLYIGILFSLLLLILQTQRSVSSVMGNIPKTDIYEAVNACDEAREIENIKIIRYESSIYYANVENFVYKIIKISQLNPHDLKYRINKKKENCFKKIKKLKSKKLNQRRSNSTASNEIMINENEPNQEQIILNRLDQEIEELLNTVKIKNIIIDFSCVNLIDSMGIEAIIKLNDAYKECKVELHLSHCKRSILRSLNKYSFFLKFQNDHVYPTTHDAVLNILNSSQPINEISIISSTYSTSNEEGSQKDILYSPLEKDVNFFSEIIVS